MGYLHDTVVIDNLYYVYQDYNKAPERLKKAQDRLSEDAFDTEAWGIFIRENQVGLNVIKLKFGGNCSYRHRYVNCV